MATAVKESIDKSFKYLEKFISVLRNGEDVLFAKERVPSRRVYKDGAKVKKILEVYDTFVTWGFNVHDQGILEDLFVEEDFAGTRTNPKYREIEFQNIADGSIEVLSISKIDKATISTAGKKTGTSFSGKESDWTETLTCYALALRQDKGSNITEEDFKDFLIRGRNEDQKVLQVINQNVLTNKDKQLVYQYGLENPNWQTSGVKVANALYASPYLKSGVSYNFVFGGDPSIKWFKSKWYNKFNNTLQNYLRRMNNITNDVKGYGSSVDDKWNPADIYAISKQTNAQKAEMRSTTMGFFAGDEKDWKKFIGKKAISASDQKVQEDMAELARYNNWIHSRILDGTLIPISLKKVLKEPNVKLVSNPSLEQFHIEVTDINVDWAVKAAKIYINFKVIYTAQVAGTKKYVKKSYNYFFDCRNFNVGENVQFELGMGTSSNQTSSAKHGKVSVGPAEMIITMTSPLVKDTLKQRRKNFVRFMRKEKLSQEGVIKSFETHVANKSRLFIDNSDINNVTENAGWPNLLGNYIKFISKETGYDLKKSDRDLKNYFKSKIASVELGWIMTAKQIQPIIKNNILKSLYLYASSQGLQIFEDSGLLKQSYFYNSSYVKVFD
jgi:hypothetical protein